MKLFFILGNQLFPIKHLNSFKNDHSFFMAEDYQLCTYEKHHKLKILLFLSAMRSYAENLKNNKEEELIFADEIVWSPSVAEIQKETNTDEVYISYSLSLIHI